MKHDHIFLSEAVAIAGGQSALARALSIYTGKKVGQSHVRTWLCRSLKNGFRGLPAEYCIPIEKITNGRVRASDLRPDVFLKGQ